MIEITARVVRCKLDAVRPARIPKVPSAGAGGAGEQDRDDAAFAVPFRRPWLIYLAGGPGAAVTHRSPRMEYMARLLRAGYVVVLLDQRGTGESTPVQAERLPPKRAPGITAGASDGAPKGGCNISRLCGSVSPGWQAAYLALHRQDSIARDAEVLRQLLLGAEGGEGGHETSARKGEGNGESGAVDPSHPPSAASSRSRSTPEDTCRVAVQGALQAAARREAPATAADSWTAMGQSFGGFIALEWMSRFPCCLAGVMLTGGLPGLKAWPEDVYRHTGRGMMEMSRQFARKYPEDARVMQKVWQLLLPRAGAASGGSGASPGVLLRFNMPGAPGPSLPRRATRRMRIKPTAGSVVKPQKAAGSGGTSAAGEAVVPPVRPPTFHPSPRSEDTCIRLSARMVRVLGCNMCSGELDRMQQLGQKALFAAVLATTQARVEASAAGDMFDQRGILLDWVRDHYGGEALMEMQAAVQRTIEQRGADEVRASEGLDLISLDLLEANAPFQLQADKDISWTRPLYTLLQEAIYMHGGPGRASNRAAERTLSELSPAYAEADAAERGEAPAREQHSQMAADGSQAAAARAFACLGPGDAAGDAPRSTASGGVADAASAKAAAGLVPPVGPALPFFGEHATSGLCQDIPFLRPLARAYAMLHAKDDWPALYNQEGLARCTAPVVAQVFRKDRFVPYDLSIETAGKIPQCKVVEDAVNGHFGLFSDPSVLPGMLQHLWDMQGMVAPAESSGTSGERVVLAAGGSPAEPAVSAVTSAASGGTGASSVSAAGPGVGGQAGGLSEGKSSQAGSAAEASEKISKCASS